MNAKSNQKNLGVIKSSNLCMEITEFSAPDEIAVCNLASVCLPRFVKVETKEFDFAELHRVAKVATRNLNCIIDRNFYPLEKARKSNLRHRPIGVGVQGLADVFMLLKMPFESPAARALNLEIFETLYHAAVETSIELAIEHLQAGVINGECQLQNFNGTNVLSILHESFVVGKMTCCPFSQKATKISTRRGCWGLFVMAAPLTRRKNAPTEYETEPGPYSTFRGSPASEGKFQFDLWDRSPPTQRYDWEALRADMMKHGLRNSLLIAPMPTASTSQILGANECFEPLTSNMYKRQTLAGEFIVMNKYLIADLQVSGRIVVHTFKSTKASFRTALHILVSLHINRSIVVCAGARPVERRYETRHHARGGLGAAHWYHPRGRA